MNHAELAVLAEKGIHPTVGPTHEAAARAAEHAIREANLPIPSGEIHCDSTPQHGPYFVWFAAFHDYTVDGVKVSGAVSGARYFVRVTCGYPGHTKLLYSLLQHESVTVEQYATTAYHQHYYTGTSLDPATDIARYVRFMGQFVAPLEEYLADFDPRSCKPMPAPPPRLPLSEGMRGDDVRHVQLIVGCRPDGIWGPAETTPAVAKWRRTHGLPVPPVEWDHDCVLVDSGLELPAPRLHLLELHPDWLAMRDERDRDWEATT